jgi:hypothetical protein
MRRQLGDTLYHLVERQRIEVLEIHTLGEACEIAAKLVDPESLQWRVANGHRDGGRVWQHLQNVLDDDRQVEADGHRGIVGVERVCAESAYVSGSDEERRGREDACSMLLEGASRGGSDCDHQIRVAFRIQTA